MSEPDALPPRPVPPRPEECCGSGCPRCVYELYDEAVAEWEKIVAARAPHPNPPTEPVERESSE